MKEPNVNLNGEPGETSLGLLARVQAQQPAAWERLVSLYGPVVYRWCIRTGLQPADAADVGQEVFQAVFRAIERFRRDRPGDSFRAWLYMVTRNKVRDHAVRVAPTLEGNALQEVLLNLSAPNLERAEEPEDQGETAFLYRQAIELIRGEFEPQTWQAFRRVVMEGARPGDVAAELGCSTNAVYVARSRILRRLREEFAALIDV